MAPATMGDADITLRHVARRRPAELARPFLPPGRSIEGVGWIDTQLTHLERRVDKGLRLHIDGELRALQIELFLDLRPEVPRRMFNYLGLLSLALDAEAQGQAAPPIESVAVVLSGRKRRWPKWGSHCTAWPKSRFSGAHFRIDAVYQRTVAELRARGSVLWLVFTPLARDATAKAMRTVVKEIQAGAEDEEDRIDLYAALLTMAKIDPWKHNLEEEIRAMLMMTPTDNERLRRILCELVQEDIDRAREEGIEKGIEKGIAKGREETREEMIRALLGRLFTRRVGRRPSTAEERALVERARDLGAEQVEDALLDHEGEALVRWLLGSDKANRKRSKVAAKRRR